jgi:hypothetical protein
MIVIYHCYLQVELKIEIDKKMNFLFENINIKYKCSDDHMSPIL